MVAWAVKVDHVSKKFAVSVAHALRYGLIDAGRRLIGGSKDSERLRSGEFWALRDVSFEVAPGEALGIMGVNGSGKTTLLRVLNGTYSPDQGTASLRGRVGALIAAGAGFSPMLSGRENIYISATLLGMDQATIRKRFDEIVDFSGIEEFIDMPVRNYSSGMSVRLGFAVCVMCDPDVLLVDEVLAVGDLAFQKKCFQRVLDLRRNGTAIIFISHSVGAVWSICQSGMFLDKGVSSGKISVEDLCRLYDIQNFRNSATALDNEGKTSSAQPQKTVDGKSLPRDHSGSAGGTGDVIVEKLEICGRSGKLQSEFELGEPLTFKMHINVINPIPQCLFRYTVDAVHYRFIFATDSFYSAGIGMCDMQHGRHIITTKIDNQNFRPGAYSINLAVCQKEFAAHLYFQAHAGTFIIKPPVDRLLYDSDSPAVMHLDTEFQREFVS